MNSLFSVKEKVILLTGGYGILGACMAKHLAREGAYVVILGRNEQKGSALVNEIKAEGGEALFLVSNAQLASARASRGLKADLYLQFGLSQTAARLRD